MTSNLKLKKFKKIKSQFFGTIVIVSKKRTTEEILFYYKNGHRDFGENRVEELITKKELLPADINWHFVGNLQTKKVKKIFDKVYLIHSLNSIKLADQLDKRASNNNITINCLVQVKIAKEATKSGIRFEMLDSFLSHCEKLENINIIGLMGMATNTDNLKLVSSEFDELNHFFNIYKSKYNLNYLSMGMSNDYKIAIKNGSNMLRIGSLLFE